MAGLDVRGGGSEVCLRRRRHERHQPVCSSIRDRLKGLTSCSCLSAAFSASLSSLAPARAPSWAVLTESSSVACSALFASSCSLVAASSEVSAATCACSSETAAWREASADSFSSLIACEGQGQASDRCEVAACSRGEARRTDLNLSANLDERLVRALGLLNGSGHALLRSLELLGELGLPV